jgi:hypothetical protein
MASPRSRFSTWCCFGDLAATLTAGQRSPHCPQPSFSTSSELSLDRRKVSSSGHVSHLATPPLDQLIPRRRPALGRYPVALPGCRGSPPRSATLVQVSRLGQAFARRQQSPASHHAVCTAVGIGQRRRSPNSARPSPQLCHLIPTQWHSRSSANVKRQLHLATNFRL